MNPSTQLLILATVALALQAVTIYATARVVWRLCRGQSPAVMNRDASGSWVVKNDKSKATAPTLSPNAKPWEP